MGHIFSCLSVDKATEPRQNRRDSATANNLGPTRSQGQFSEPSNLPSHPDNEHDRRKDSAAGVAGVATRN